MNQNVAKSSPRRVITLESLCQTLQLDPSLYLDSPQFPLLVPQHWWDKFEVGNPNDPLLLQIIPRKSESIDSKWSFDAVGDLNASLCDGLIQKYKTRALLISSPACQVHCRYCFRRHYPYEQGPKNDEAILRAINELKDNQELNEIILSGGDPLTLPPSRLEIIIQKISTLPQIKTVRLHSRSVTVDPVKTTKKLLESFEKFQGQKVLVTHVNHPKELDEETHQAISLWKTYGWTVFNQSVLLKGVNDKTSTLVELSHKLFEQGALPYYLNLLDRVQGAEEFEVDDIQALELHQEMKTQTSGYLVPKLVREIPGEPNKTWVN